MSLQPQDVPAIPDETARVARAAFPKGNTIMRMRDDFGSFYADQMFTHLYGKRGAPGYAPWRLALITIFQYMEDLSDRQAADAVRSRLDWKYARSLELTDAGFDYSILCMFRARLLDGEAEQKLFDVVLDAFKARGFLKARGKQRTDSTHILGAVRSLNRLGCVHETLRHTLNVLASALPQWVETHVPPEWFERYAQHLEEFRLPKAEAERQKLAVHIGQMVIFCLARSIIHRHSSGCANYRRLRHFAKCGCSNICGKTRVSSGVKPQTSRPR